MRITISLLTREEALSLLPDTETSFSWTRRSLSLEFRSRTIDQCHLVDELPIEGLTFGLCRDSEVGGGFVDLVAVWDNRARQLLADVGYLQTDERKIARWMQSGFNRKEAVRAECR